MELLTRELDMSSVKAYVIPPAGTPHLVKIGANGQCVYVPDKYGMHEIQLQIEDQK